MQREVRIGYEPKTYNMDADPKYVKRRYLSIKTPGGLRGAFGFLKNSKYKDSKKVISALRDLKTLHKPFRLRFKRRPIICSHTDLMWGVDLIVCEQFKRQNGGYAYIMLAVDCFNKMVFVQKLKSKNSAHVEKALELMFKQSKRKPEKIFSDKEAAFMSKRLKEFFIKNNVQIYNSVSWLHSSIGERYLGTYRRILARIFTHNGNNKWLGLEQDVANQMNNSYNSAIRMRPADVNKKNESIVWDHLYSKYITQKPIKARFKVGDSVRISTRTLKDVFKKSYDVSWSLEVFRVVVPYYSLEDSNGEDIEGKYYNEDLQLVGDENGG